MYGQRAVRIAVLTDEGNQDGCCWITILWAPNIFFRSTMGGQENGHERETRQALEGNGAG